MKEGCVGRKRPIRHLWDGVPTWDSSWSWSQLSRESTGALHRAWCLPFLSWPLSRGSLVPLPVFPSPGLSRHLSPGWHLPDCPAPTQACRGRVGGVVSLGPQNLSASSSMTPLRLGWNCRSVSLSSVEPGAVSVHPPPLVLWARWVLVECLGNKRTGS